jgi:Cu/Ag efflux protein CusF
MPTKLGKSHKTIDRQTKKVTVNHPYIKGFSKTDLIEKYNTANTRPKDKQKIKNELVRRGGVVFNVKEE